MAMDAAQNNGNSQPKTFEAESYLPKNKTNHPSTATSHVTSKCSSTPEKYVLKIFQRSPMIVELPSCAGNSTVQVHKSLKRPTAIKYRQTSPNGTMAPMENTANCRMVSPTAWRFRIHSKSSQTPANTPYVTTCCLMVNATPSSNPATAMCRIRCVAIPFCNMSSPPMANGISSWLAWAANPFTFGLNEVSAKTDADTAPTQLLKTLPNSL